MGLLLMCAMLLINMLIIIAMFDVHPPENSIFDVLVKPSARCRCIWQLT
jgi:hypothetical protein